MEQQPNTHGLIPLSDADHLKVADGNEDVRGWEIRTDDGERIGKVKDLIIDPNVMRARYLDAQLDSKLFGGDRRVLIPIGAARLEDDDDAVVVNLSRDEIAKSPPYEGHGFTSEYESSLRSSYAGTFGRGKNREIDDARYYDDRGLLGTRRARGADRGAERDEARMTRSEEELAIGKRRVEAGEAYLRKRVETEHVSKPVTRTREEISVERRPVERAASGNVEIGDQEIRVPVTEEEIVVEKRPVVKEEIVVTKRAVEETQNVEADVRRERVDVDDQAIRDRAKSAGRKAADAAENVKDRIDGNPRT